MKRSPSPKTAAIFEGQFYKNGRGDVLGPMRPCFLAGWIEDQHGTHYDVTTGAQYGHVKGSTGNLVAIASQAEIAKATGQGSSNQIEGEGSHE